MGAESKTPTCVSAGRRCCSPAKGYVARGGVEPPTFRFSVGRSYQLSYLALQHATEVVDAVATPTGLEPATSAVTGRRSNQLSYGALGGLLILLRQPADPPILPAADWVPPTGFEPVLPP